MQGIYEAAEIYHYGFGFRDVARDANVLIAASQRFGNSGRHFLEIACGDCPYAEALLHAGMDYHGLDLSNSMLDFSAIHIRAAGYTPDDRLHLADMRDFTLSQKFDLAFVLMGSLHYLNNDEFLQHLDCVHGHLTPGGLYVQEWCIEFMPWTEQNDTWTQNSPLGEVRVNYSARQKFAATQIFEERIEFELDGELTATTTDLIYTRYPNEFALLLQSREEQWETVGHFNDWNLDSPVSKADKINRPLCILKKRDR